MLDYVDPVIAYPAIVLLWGTYFFLRFADKKAQESEKKELDKEIR